tara:strand:+ start:285 stop:683 length:399 start_codon:yes stop_codon:yes gene_type:complete
MGLFQNLKKKFNNWVDKTLAELSSAYIIQLAKQTTKRQDNSLETTSSLKPWVMEHQHTTTATSSPDISKRTTLEETEEVVAHVTQWARKKLEDAVTIGEKDALYREFEEWIELHDEDECDIISVEFEESEQT